MPRTKEEIEKLIVAEEETLRGVSSRRSEFEDKVKTAMGILESARQEKEVFEEAIVDQQNLIGVLRRELEGQTDDEKDFADFPHEWQKKSIRFMRLHPGVAMHFTALIGEVTKEMGDIPHTQKRSRMLNHLSHLITQKKVEKGKNGNYTWVVYPKDWKGIAPVIPISRVSTSAIGTPHTTREEVANRYFADIVGGKDYLQREELEKMFHADLCFLHLCQDTDPQFEINSQFIERYLYTRAQPGGPLAIYKKDERLRQGGELSEHRITSAVKDPPGAPWVRVERPTVRQPAIDTKRKGGSKG